MHAMLKIQSIHFKKTGFTLIELLVVVAITSIVVGGSIAGFTKFYERQQVLTAAQEVRQLFVTAKTKAQVQETPSNANCTTAGVLIGYRVRFISPSTFRLYAICKKDSDGSLVQVNPSSQVQEVVMPAGVSVTEPTADKIYDFFTLGEGTSLNSDQTITLSGSSKTYGFSVTSGGAISEVN